MDTAENWKEWALGQRKIPHTQESPELEFTEPLFRRRLSQLSRMTIKVIHDLLPIPEDCPIVFLSFRGEIAQQLKINKMLIEQNALLPAAFSLSVFNAPIALAAIALNLTAGYTAIFPSARCFYTGFQIAAAPIISERGKKTVLVYADELVPAEYDRLRPAENEPLAFAVILSAQSCPRALALQLPGNPSAAGAILESPRAFLRRLCLHGEF
ncbi:MAG: beta-ketoacyl synthase chain length factor [Spirochaetia bacterium]|nr:beta-ketoacyl synthase chain length factor [Spirochaetia bacterium]